MCIVKLNSTEISIPKMEVNIIVRNQLSELYFLTPDFGLLLTQVILFCSGNKKNN